MTKTFTAQLEGFRDLTITKINYVMRNGIDDVLEAAQTPQAKAAIRGGPPVIGKIPVDSSTLINSLTVDGAKGPDAYVTAIAGMRIGQIKRFAWTAPYALAINNGFTVKSASGDWEYPGAHFVDANAERFSDFIANRTREVKT